MSRSYQRVMLAALVACGGSEPASQTPPALVGNTAPPPSAAVDETPPPVKDAPAELPASCVEYRRTLHALMVCDTLAPATKDSLTEAYDALSATWVTTDDLSEELGPASLSCKAANDGLLQIADAFACPL
jgi:hypothetical protein